MTLFEYINNNHTPTLQYIDGATGISANWQQVSSLPLLVLGGQKKLGFLYLDNSLTSVSILFSALKAGHCVCLLNQDLGIELKENLENNYNPSFIVDAKRQHIEDYEESEIKGSNDVTVHVFHTSAYQYPVHTELCLLLPTSGTTGSPKFVKLSHENLIANATSVIEYLPISRDDSTPLNLPIYYSYGLSVLLTNSIAGGKIICTNESILSRNFWNLFTKYACNNFSGVPYTYEMLNRIGFGKMQGLRLKYFTQAGGKLDVKHRKIFADYALEHNARFFVMYGQTEAAPRMAFLDPKEAIAKIESIGKAIPGGKLSLDPETGELIYEGKNIFRGYAYSSNDLSELETIKALRTGDVAKADSDGFHYITGRLNRFIKLFGNRIGLDEVEQQLRKKFDGTIGCSGVNDQFILIISDNELLVADEVRNFLSGLFGIHISAIRFKLLQPIPLNSNQKIDYPKILAEYDK